MWKHRGDSRPVFAHATGPGQESVWDYPRPPRIEPDRRAVVVAYRGVEIANTSSAVRVLETASPPTFYLPANDVRTDLLAPSPGVSICEWKGRASYWSIVLPGQPPLHQAAWGYAAPLEGYESLAGRFSFYAGLVECYVAGERVAPQPGAFYGGWVTRDVIGPFKGEPGTQRW